MGSSGAIIMSFFGAVFAAMTLALALHWSGPILGLPFLAFAIIALIAANTIRRPGDGIVASERAGRIIMWSSIGEGVGLFVAGNVVMNVGHPEMLLPAMALVVGLHFLPMEHGIPFRPFYVLGCALIAAGLIGAAMARDSGGTFAGFAASAALLIASIMAVSRDRRSKAG